KKPVYCEKPLTHNVWEARQVARVAKESGVATTMGNQGHSGDFFCHNFDPAMWALNLREPLSIEASAAGAVDKYIAPAAGLYTYHFGPRADKPAVKFTWYEGGLKPPRPDAMADNEQFDGNGIL